MTRVVDALVQPALLLADDGVVHHANPAAIARFGGAPATCFAAFGRRDGRCPTCALDEARAGASDLRPGGPAASS